MKMQAMHLIAAVDQDWGIGNHGELLFHIPQDMRFFREKTMGHTVVMGRKTFESLPGKKPLVGRRNIVLSSTMQEAPAGFCLCTDLRDLFDTLAQNDGETFVIGGETVYTQLAPYCRDAWITHVHASAHADKHLILDDGWALERMGEKQQHESLTFAFAHYINNALKTALPDE